MADRESELSALLSSATLVVVGTIVGSVAKLVERVIVGRMLTLEAYGEVSIGFAAVTICSMFALLGFDQGIPRYMSRFETEQQVRGAWLTGLAIAAVAAVVTTGALYLNADFLAGQLFDQAGSAELMKVFLLCIPMAVGLNVGVSAIRGLENTLYGTVVQNLLYPLTRIGLLVVFLYMGYDVLSAGYAYLAAAALGFVASHLLLNRLMSLRGPFELHLREMVGFSAPMVIASVLSILLVQTDTLMLGAMRESSEVALYGAAYPLAWGMMLVLSAFGFIYLPLVSRLDAGGEHGEIDAVYKITSKWIFVVTFPAFVAFAVFPRDVLTIFFDARYADAAPALVILSVGFFANAAFGRNRQTLSALGDSKALMYANVVTFSVNIVLNLLLIPRMGFVGAAVASASSYFTINLVLTGVLGRRYGISPFSSATVRTFVGVPAVLLPAAYLLSQQVTLTAMTLVPFLVGTGLLALAVTAAVGGLQPEDGVAVGFVEESIGVELPTVRRYIPAGSEPESID